MSRKSFLEEGKISEERVKEAWGKCSTLPQVAKELGVAENTARKYTRICGISVKRGRPKGHHKHYGSLIRWVREHKDVPLPKGVAAIKVLTGCTTEAISAYLKRGRAEIRAYLKTLPDLKKTSLRFRSENGVIIPFRALKHYTLTFHPWSFKITLSCAIARKTFKKAFTFKQFKRFTKEAKA